MKGKVPAKKLKLKRAYEEPAPADGRRVLVDRLWPRGLKKEAAALALGEGSRAEQRVAEMVRSRPRALG